MTERAQPGQRSTTGAVAERREGRALLAVASLLLLLLLGIPLFALVRAAAPAEVAARLGDPLVLSALRLSLVTSGIATLVCVLLGLPLAYLLARHRFPGAAAVDTLIDLPMTMPPVVAGVALLLTFGRVGLLGRHLEAAGVQVAFSTLAVVLAQTFMAAPFFVRAARAGFEAVPLSLEQAAMTLGRNRWGVFWTISVPLAAPALGAGAVLCWARALSEFGATMMFAGNRPEVTQTLPLAVMSAMETNLQLAITISLLSLLLAFGALAGVRLLVRRWGR
ncbi:MAG: ABC transporter permease [Armatimonadota bacterium]